MMQIEYVCTKCGDIITAHHPFSRCPYCGGALRSRGRYQIRVRDYGQTYIATCGRRQASCTAGRKAAAEALARKLFAEKPFIMSYINDRTYLVIEEGKSEA
jgi:DNA-directed RNA polymerase subunit RPC12/RpoP